MKEARRGERRTGQVREAIREELARDAAKSPRANGREGVPVIEMQNVSLSFDQPILEDVSLKAQQGETIVIVGESGTGKSTAMKLILRLLVAEQGRVLIDGDDITHLSFEVALQVRQ